jgi:hypothetical protein
MRQDVAEVLAPVLVFFCALLIKLRQASSNVQKRIEFIKAELKRADGRVAEASHL